MKEGKTLCLQVTWFNQGAYKFQEEVGFKGIENKYVFPDWRKFYE